MRVENRLFVHKNTTLNTLQEMNIQRTDLDDEERDNEELDGSEARGHD